MSTAQRYRKKPIEIDAMRLTAENAKDVCDWMQSSYVLGHAPESHQGHGIGEHGVIVILTLEGEMTAEVGDWIIRGIQGEFYPCKPEIFEATYVESPDVDLRWAPLTDDELTADEVARLDSTAAAVTEFGAGAATLSGRNSHGELTFLSTVAAVPGSLVGFVVRPDIDDDGEQLDVIVATHPEVQS